MKNQITVFLIMFGLLLWVIQVVNLNRGKENNVMYVEQGQEFYYGGLAIQADEFLLLDSDEYGTYFGMENDVADSEKAADATDYIDRCIYLSGRGAFCYYSGCKLQDNWKASI